MAHTFHMNIKPANFVLKFRKDLIFIDWEQSGAALYTLAPEADGSWDVKEARIGSPYRGGADSAESKLVYEKYYGSDILRVYFYNNLMQALLKFILDSLRFSQRGKICSSAGSLVGIILLIDR